MPPDSTNNWIFLVLLFCSGLFFIVTNGSQTPPPTSDVNIITSAASIHEELTTDFSLNCTYHHNQTSATTGLMSIILSKSVDFESDDFKEIAALTFLSGQTVDVKDDVGGAQVIGHFEPSHGMSFISYQWKYPMSKVECKYQCSVHGMDSLGHPVARSTVAVIKQQNLTIDTALNRLHNCEKSKDQLQTELSLTKSQLNTTQHNLSQVSQELDQSTLLLNTTQQELHKSQDLLNSTQQDLLQSNVRLNHTHLKLETLNPFLQYSIVYNNHFYFISRIQVINVPLFQHKCQEKGGYLAEINDEKEYTAMHDFLLSLDDNGQFYYMGITDEGHAGRWTYMTSGDDAFVKWAPKYPASTGDTHCAVWFKYYGKAEWVDRACVSDFASSYLCEIDL